MHKLVTRLLIIAALSCFSVAAQAQQIHPKKKIYRDVGSWRTTAPGKSTSLKNFVPFRAVYDRTYRQGSGSNSGDPRQDRVIISAEETGWDGKESVAITLIDSGIAGQKDTNARSLTMFVDRNDLSLLFEIGPIPGKAKDYYIARVEKDAAYINSVMTKTQKLQPEKMRDVQPGFGPSAWVLASMGLRQGRKMKLAPTYSPEGNPLTAVYAGHIAGNETFTDGAGTEHEAWVLETTKSFSSPMIKRVYLIDQPPYYLGTESVNLDTGERKRFVWLRTVDLFEPATDESSADNK